MFCMKCGANNPDNFTFCTACGTPLPKAAVESAPGEPKKKNTGKTVVAVVSTILVLAIVVISIILIKGAMDSIGSSDKDSGKSDADRSSSIAQSPEELLDNIITATAEGDSELAVACMGMDYYRSKKTVYGARSLDEVIADKVTELQDEELEETGLDVDEWVDRFERVDSVEEFISLEEEYFKAYRKQINAEAWYEEIEIRKLEGVEAEEAKLDLDRMWGSMTAEGEELFYYTPDDVIAFYRADVESHTSDDLNGEEVKQESMIIIETEEGFFLAWTISQSPDESN